MSSTNLSAKKRKRMLEFLDKLKTQFSEDNNPEASESSNDQKIDREEVLKAINEIENELINKKYGLVWEEHEEEVDRMFENNIPVFSEEKDKEIINDAENEGYNFLLEGDNLHSLRLLGKTHKGKIDVIYIDPPYNTGNKDFVYDDKYVGEDDSYRHSKWISFINERLGTARSLLKEDGLIFISINDCELSSVKLLCDGIMGEKNYVENFIWVKNSGGSLSKTTLTRHEYVLCYAKNIEKSYRNSIYMMLKPGYREITNLIEKSKDNKCSIEETEQIIKKYYKNNPDLKGISLYNNIDEEYRCFRTLPITAPNNQFYDVLHPITKKPVKVPPRGWSWSKETMEKNIKNGKVLFGKDESYGISQKLYLEDAKYEHKRSTFNCDQAEGNKDLKNVLSKNNVFDNPKPVSLLNYILQNANKNSIVLDFFAGSGTTGQAVLELNKEDGGNRKFILCTNNENNICEDVTYQRVKTVITGKRKDGSEYSEGIPANLKYYKTDFVSKDAEYVEDDLLRSTKELIQLEHGIDIDKSDYCLVLSEEDADGLEKKIDGMESLKGIYIANDVLLTSNQKDIFKNYEQYIIPDCFYEKEIINIT